MPRASQLRGEGGVFHLTHRCHNRAFLLKFARDRDAYRAKLREHLHQFDMALLDYCLTSNRLGLLQFRLMELVPVMVLVGDRGVMLGIGTAEKVFNS